VANGKRTVLRMPVVAVDGNIGVGKSSMLDKLAGKKFPFKHVVLKEPVEQWQQMRDEKGSIIERYYSDMERYSFLFQTYAMLTRARKMVEVLKEGNDVVVFVERSLLTDRTIFAQASADAGRLDAIEWAVYKELFELTTKELSLDVDAFLYMRAPPETCLDRVGLRKRPGEENITIEYLRELHARHENWLATGNPDVLVVECDTDMDDGAYWGAVFERVEAFVSAKLSRVGPSVLVLQDAPAR